ncbi:MAG: saccharopine dehydrogenase NADP-binding domain-containing protein, partial [Promethearchaeota archaeon]
MTSIIVLGGCGVVGTAAVKTLAKSKEFDEVVIADINLAKANKIAEKIGEKVSAIKFDANNT